MSSQYKKLKEVENQINELCLLKKLKMEAEHLKRIKCYKTLRLYISTYFDSEGLFLRINSRVINDFKNSEIMILSDLVERLCIVIERNNCNNKYNNHKDMTDTQNNNMNDTKNNNIDDSINDSIKNNINDTKNNNINDSIKNNINNNINDNINDSFNNNVNKNEDIPINNVNDNNNINDTINDSINNNSINNNLNDSINNNNNSNDMNYNNNNNNLNDTNYNGDKGNVIVHEWIMQGNKVDSFELKSCICKELKIIFTVKNTRNIMKLSDTLSSLLSVSTSCKPNLIGLIYKYVTKHNLFGKDNIVKCNKELQEIFNIDSFYFTDLPELLEEHLFPLDDIEITIPFKMDYSSYCYDIPVELDDLFQHPKVHHKDVYLLERRIDTVNELKMNLEKRREILQRFSNNPIEFINRWICLDLEEFSNKTSVFRNEKVQDIMYELLKDVI